MKDEEKTKRQLINELVELRREIVKLKASGSRKNHTEGLQTASAVTERKPVEEKLYTIQKHLLNIIEFLPDATFVVDRARKVIAWNQAMEEMTGVPKEKIIGKGDYAYSVPFYGKARPILVDLIFSIDRETKRKYEYVERKGEKLYAESSLPLSFGVYKRKGAYLWGAASPLYDDNGNMIGAVETIHTSPKKSS